MVRHCERSEAISAACASGGDCFVALDYYATQNPKAFGLLPPDIAKLMPTHPDNEKVAHMVNYEWWADNTAQATRRFEQWVQS